MMLSKHRRGSTLVAEREVLDDPKQCDPDGANQAVTPDSLPSIGVLHACCMESPGNNENGRKLAEIRRTSQDTQNDERKPHNSLN